MNTHIGFGGHTGHPGTTVISSSLNTSIFGHCTTLMVAQAPKASYFTNTPLWCFPTNLSKIKV